MLEFLAAVSVVATHLTAFPIPAVLDAEGMKQVRKDCGLSHNATILDARSLKTAQEVADRIAPEPARPTIVHAANLAGQDVAVLLEKLEGGCIHSSDLSLSQASRSKFRDASLVMSVIEGANWSRADLAGTRFVGVNAKEANFAGAKMDRGAWVGAFGRSWLLRSDFTGASLRGFTFVCDRPEEFDCRGDGKGKFDGVDFTDADFAQYGFMGWRSFKGARIDRTRIDPAQVPWLKDVDLGAEVILAAGPAREHAASVSVAGAEFSRLQAESLSLSNDDPSFDCDKATSYAEENICGEWGNLLRAYDRELDEVARFAKDKGLPGIDRAQRQWQIERDRCEETRCIYLSYQNRLTELFAAVGTRIELPPGKTLRFDEAAIQLSNATRKTPLYQRVLSVLREASDATVVLTGLEGGRIRVRGSLVGLHGETCRWNADTRYDAASGWYVARTEAGKWVPTFRVWKSELQPTTGGYARVEEPADDEFFENCSAFASFGRLQLLSAD